MAPRSDRSVSNWANHLANSVEFAEHEAQERPRFETPKGRIIAIDTLRLSRDRDFKKIGGSS